MNDNFVKKVLSDMSCVLNNYQIEKLKNALNHCLYGKVIVKNCDNELNVSIDYISCFLSSKKLEGCSDRTINYYKITIDNIRRILSSYFSWLEDEDFIIKSPIRRIHKIKTQILIKETYNDEILEKLRDGCNNIRDLAIIDFLSSTGVRVGELVQLNINDIDFVNRSCIVLGKGNKEREIYFDARTKLHLEKYLSMRKDDNKALFVSLISPYKRLNISGVEIRLRNIGKKSNILKVHPHKFRRTLATKAIDKGMPIEQVQQLLGHSKIDTTMHYAMVKQSNVKTSHQKYIC